MIAWLLHHARWILAGTMGAVALAACVTPVPTTDVPIGPTATPPAAVAPDTQAPVSLEELPCLTHDELVQLTLAERALFPTLCLLSDDGTRTTIEQAEHVEAIRRFTGIPELVVAFESVTPAPNAPDNTLRTAVYQDDRGMDYYFAVVAGKVVEMSPRSYNPTAGPSTLSDEELLVLAEDQVRREFPEFDELRDRLSFEVGSKGGGLNFFRWQDNSGANWPNMPPLAQVGLTSSGEMFSYINTLFYLR